ncbi:hypothetical protein H4R35_001856 [Dimargaris xerosporica]|nr:hypothetical protein H4R35_001856 [Dimargaris xerosporica]
MIQELRQSYPKLVPQVIMVDGNGVLHPRRFGLASHLGVIADIPTIGIAKNFLQIDDGAQLTVKAVRERFQACLVRGHRQLILQGESGQIYGMAMCTPATTKPIYVSVGHRISLNTAAMLSQLCCRYRIPEPVRMADLLTRQYIRDHLG